MKKTSEEWNREDSVTISDPDGWDRTNWVHSWYVEEITKVEYEGRVCLSTCMWEDETV